MRADQTCSICGKPPDQRHRPFCSRRCAEIDLGRWLTESYTIAVPAEEGEEKRDEGESPPPA